MLAVMRDFFQYWVNNFTSQLRGLAVLKPLAVVSGGCQTQASSVQLLTLLALGSFGCRWPIFFSFTDALAVATTDDSLLLNQICIVHILEDKDVQKEKGMLCTCIREEGDAYHIQGGS